MSKKESIKNILKDLYNEKQKQLDRDAAHSLKAYVSSLRILFGAFNLGDIDENSFVDVLNTMKNSCHSNLDIDTYLRESASFRNSVKKPRNPLHNTISKAGGKILLIDDEYKSIGWDMVFDAIFGSGNILYAEDKNTALQLLVEGEIALVLLDLKLPFTPLEGIELLREIKMKRLDLPVVIFTGEDTIKFQRKCFSEGAFDYFVKAYKEEDKNYLEYYETFKDIIQNALKLSGKGDIWRDIIKLEEDIKQSGPPYFHDTIHYLKKAYYFLTIDEDNWITTMLLSKNNITYYAEVVIQCSLAIEGLINKLFDDNRNIPKIKALSEGKDSENIIYGKKLQGLKIIGILDSNSERVFEEINKSRKDCVHPQKKGLIINEEQAVATLRKTINTAIQIIFSEHVLGIANINPTSQTQNNETTNFKIKKIISNMIPGKFTEIKVEEVVPIKVTIFTSTPGVVIGKKGSTVNMLKEKIESQFGKTRIDVKEIGKV